MNGFMNAFTVFQKKETKIQANLVTCHSEHNTASEQRESGADLIS